MQPDSTARPIAEHSKLLVEPDLSQMSREVPGCTDLEVCSRILDVASVQVASAE